MNKPLNIKGVTTSFTRHWGGGTGRTVAHRVLTKKGYSSAVKKALKTSELSKIKKQFKAAGISTHRFNTSEAIKEKDLIADLKLLAKAGILKESVGIAAFRFRREQIKENYDLTRKEKRAFQRLVKPTKKELLWGKQSEKVKFSPGAKIAADNTKTREAELGKTRFGIRGYGNLKDTDLGKKIRLIQKIRHKTPEMSDELKKLAMDELTIRRQAKSNPRLLKKFKLVEIQKTKESAWKPKKLDQDESQISVGGKKVSSSELSKNKKDKEGNKDEKKDSSNSQSQISIASPANSELLTGIPSDKKIVDLPFTKVNQTLSPEKAANETKFFPSTNNSENIPAVQKVGKQFGFINPTSEKVEVENDDNSSVSNNSSKISITSPANAKSFAELSNDEKDVNLPFTKINPTLSSNKAANEAEFSPSTNKQEDVSANQPEVEDDEEDYEERKAA